MIDMSMCTREGVLILCYCFIEIIILNSVLYLYSWCMNGFIAS